MLRAINMKHRLAKADLALCMAPWSLWVS